ncbi:protein rolling stone [Halyomorpha halys]|uniref:protein rolling stone n=1 Tax=Halyomorpha halys TaxID=286706 RepID=UPI0006D50C58|nr:protein rolling stone-like [Halyomorpha halys]XP_014275599.1 protein rolling stone-like [Halyomorpha halys]
MVIAILFTKLRSKISSLEKVEPLLYYKCQWENKTDNVSIGFLTYKWLHFIILISAILLSLLNNEEGHPARWPIYLTNWALILYFVQALLGTFIVTNAYYCIKKGKSLEQSGRFMQIYGALQSTAIVTAFGVTFVYWCFVHNPEIHKMNVVNISSHICNSIIMLIDLFMVAHPVKLVDIVFPLFYSLLYTGFNIIYFLCGGTDRKGNPYVYKVLDWRRPVHAISFVHGGLLLLIIIFIIVWLLSILRRSISHRFEATHDLVPQQEPPFELSIA